MQTSQSQASSARCRRHRGSGPIDKQLVQQLQGQHSVNATRVVSIAAEMAADHRLESGRFEIRPSTRARVQQHVSNVRGEGISVPCSKMHCLVPAEKELLETERGQKPVDPGQPLWHTVIVGVLGLEHELEQASRRGACTDTDITPDARQSRISVADETETDVAVVRRAENEADELVVEIWRSYGELRLLEPEHAEVRPGRLSECRKRQGVFA